MKKYLEKQEDSANTWKNLAEMIKITIPLVKKFFLNTFILIEMRLIPVILNT